MIAAGYLRVSTDAQASADRYGLESQRSDIETYAKAYGFEIGLWFVDAGISGATLDRPGLSDLLSSSLSHSFTAVITAKMDRVARDLMAQLWIEKELLKAGVEIISVAEPFRSQDATNRLFRQIIGAFAEFEKARITDRLSGGRIAKARQGGYAGGRAPMGYGALRGSHTLTVAPEQAATVRQVFALRSTGKTLRSVASELNAMGAKTHEGKLWHASQVRRVLDLAFLYRGGYKYAGITTEKGKQDTILTG